jgi:hypothetical protein
VAKKPAKHIIKFTHDNLAHALAQLTCTNEGTVAALPLLWNSILATAVVPALAAYSFEYGNLSYQATLSSYQWEAIAAALRSGDDVLATVIGLLSELTTDLSDCACGLVDTLTGASEPQSGSGSQSPVGCCTFDGQRTPLTQLQCSQYTMSSWNGSDPHCMGKPDAGGR